MKVVKTNLRNSFPEKSERELAVIRRRFYRTRSEILVDTINMAYMNEEKGRTVLTVKDVEKHVEAVHGRDWIAMTAHFGCWEYCSYWGLYERSQEAIKESYKSAEAFDENNLAVVSKKEDKYYLINNKGKKVSEQYVRIMYLGEKYYAGYTTGSKYEVFDVEGNKVINDYFMDEGTTFVYNDVVYGIFNKSGSSYIYDMNENEVVFSVEGDLEFNEKGYFVTVDGDAYYSLKGEKIYKR